MSLQFGRLPALVAAGCTLIHGCAARTPPAAGPAPAPAVLSRLLEDARSLDRPSNAERLEAVQTMLRGRGIPFTLESVPNTGGPRDPRPAGHNVVIDVPGPPGPAIVLGAHLDAAPLADGGLSHGMVDNAAGTVVVTRLAEALRARPLRRRVRVVLFDLEEHGLQGSRQYAAALDRDAVIAMVNVDIAAYGDTILSGRTHTAGAAPLHRALAGVCAARAVDCLHFAEFPGSDDRSFDLAGIPAISLAVLPALEAHQVWLLLHGGKESGLAPGFAPAILRTIHTAADTADRLSAAGMTLVYDVTLGLLEALSAN